jgi:hypothetical protein
VTLIKDLNCEFSILKDNSLKKQGQSNGFLVYRVRRNGRNDVHDDAVTLRWRHGGKLIFDTGLSSGCIFTIQVRSVVFISTVFAGWTIGDVFTVNSIFEGATFQHASEFCASTFEIEI